MLENLFVVILTFYPLRHIFKGLDLWDTGYNYANFQYMGMEHMDPMWLFSTYLANVAGNFLRSLPAADSLAGMNFYTGLFVSVLALVGYFFCTRKLNMPGGVAFLGEMLAISLCWSPTAVLYNYLTYVMFLISCILLYLGLIKDSKRCLIGAGVLLGANVLVRFSNLPEMAMIVAVWAYNIILWLEERKAARGNEKTATSRSAKESEKTAANKAVQNGKTQFWPRLLRHTLWCLVGYLAALAVLFGYIHIRYGMDEYVAGILRLFAMTDNATDYKPTSMVMGLIGAYVENLYWVIRIGVIVVGGLAAFSMGHLAKHLSKTGKLVWTVAGITITGVVFAHKLMTKQPSMQEFLFELDGLFLLLLLLCAVFGWVKRLPRILWIAACAVMLGWLYYRHFCSWYFYSYDSMLRPGILFLMLTMFIAVIRIFHRSSPKEEKLLSGILILIILLTSLGSNNGVYPSINNLFLAAPYTLWQSWRFVKGVNIWNKLKVDLIIDAFPAKGVLVVFLAMCIFQSGMFGATFVFAEATGVQDFTGKVDNNVILQNIRMPAERAEWLTEISSYVEEQNLQGKEVILYGRIPSLSFYLQMPSAFNPWSDLASYSYETMQENMAQLEGLIMEKGAEHPIFIVENVYALHEEGGVAAMAEGGVAEAKQQEVDTDKKWQLILEFMEEYGYEQAFRNEKFALYR